MIFLFFFFFLQCIVFWVLIGCRPYQSINSVPCLLHRMHSVCLIYINLLLQSLFSFYNAGFISYEGLNLCVKMLMSV